MMMMATKSILASVKGEWGAGKNSRDLKREEESGNSWELGLRRE